jgi:hypothetical protein
VSTRGVPRNRPRKTTVLTETYLALLAVRLVLYALQYLGPESAKAFVERLSYLHLGLLIAQFIVGLMWLYRAWARIPKHARKTYDGRHVEPDSAVLGFFVPVYNLYWCFIANIGLCGAIDGQLRRAFRKPRAPSNFALVTCIVQVIPAIGLIFAPLFWAVFMPWVDGIQAEVEADDIAG